MPLRFLLPTLVCIGTTVLLASSGASDLVAMLPLFVLVALASSDRFGW